LVDFSPARRALGAGVLIRAHQSCSFGVTLGDAGRDPIVDFARQPSAFVCADLQRPGKSALLD
jgi:hypothetical protein